MTDSPMPLWEAWSNLCRATSELLWNYSPETLVVCGFLAGMMAGLLLALVTYQ